LCFIFFRFFLKKLPLFLKRCFFFFFKLSCCGINLVFFNLVFLVLYFLPVCLFGFFRFIINYRIFLFLLFFLFIFNIKVFVYLFFVFVSIFVKHYFYTDVNTYYDIMFLVYNPNLKIYNFDFYIRFGELNVIEWFENYQRLHILYDRTYTRW
jgi:hypothetical protein